LRRSISISKAFIRLAAAPWLVHCIRSLPRSSRACSPRDISFVRAATTVNSIPRNSTPRSALFRRCVKAARAPDQGQNVQARVHVALVIHGDRRADHADDDDRLSTGCNRRAHARTDAIADGRSMACESSYAYDIVGGGRTRPHVEQLDSGMCASCTCSTRT
jgi:hypothetical protein